MTLTIPMPSLPCFVHRLFLHDMQDCHGEWEKGYAFAASSRPGRALEFWVMTERGGTFQGVPVNALASKDFSVPANLSAVNVLCKEPPILQWWDCPSYNAVAVQLPFLCNWRGSVRVPKLEAVWHTFEYFCTFDWYADQTQRINCTHAEEPAEKKAQHLLKLDNGGFCLAPNDKIHWAKDSWMDGYDKAPDYKRNTHTWIAEK